MSPDATGPRVTVIIPCRDVVAYLGDALASVGEQGVAPVQVVVVDDASTEPIEPQVAALRPGTTVLRHEQPRGPAAARNTGLAVAEAPFIAFLDADDIWEAGGIARHLKCLREAPAALFSLAATEIVCMPTRDSGATVGRTLRKATVDPLLPACVFRREAFDVVGLLDPSLTFGEDGDWFLRAREKNVPYITSPERYLWYRRHDRNMTCGKNLRELFVPQAIIRSLRRRREQGALAPLPPLRRHDETSGRV